MEKEGKQFLFGWLFCFGLVSLAGLPSLMQQISKFTRLFSSFRILAYFVLAICFHSSCVTMKASRSNRPPNGVSVEHYRSTLTPSVSGGVEVNTELKLQCSTLTNDSDQQEVGKNGIVCMVNAGVGVET